MGDELYESNYSISSLRQKLLEESEEILEEGGMHGLGYFPFLEVIYSGVEHEKMNFPALGGSPFRS